MLKHFINTKEFLYIPMSMDYYKIDRTGCVQRRDGTAVDHEIDHNGDRVVWIFMWNGWEYFKVSFLLVLTFKPITVPMYLWSRLSVDFLDGDNGNLKLGNLIWRFPVGLEHDMYPGFAFIPGCTRYVISKEGIYLNHLTGKQLITYTAEDGYVELYATFDTNRSKRISRHRAIGLAWLEYPTDADFKMVNHIDGVPGNDQISNLEWATHRENEFHAIKMGLRGNRSYANFLNEDSLIDSIHILTRNAKTGEIKEYESQTACERDLGLTTGGVFYRLNESKHRVHEGYLQFKVKADESPWPEIEDVEAEYAAFMYSNTVLCKSVITGEVKEYPSARVCAFELGLCELAVATRLRNKGQKVYEGGLQFQRKKDFVPWREVKDVDAELAKCAYAIEVDARNIFTGEITHYPNVDATAAAIGTSAGVVMDRIMGRMKTPFLQYDFKKTSEPEWRTYSASEMELFRQSFEDNFSFQGLGFVLTHVETGEVRLYANRQRICDEYQISKCSISQMSKAKKVFRNTWKFEYFYPCE